MAMKLKTLAGGGRKPPDRGDADLLEREGGPMRAAAARRVLRLALLAGNRAERRIVAAHAWQGRPLADAAREAGVTAARAAELFESLCARERAARRPAAVRAARTAAE